MNIGHLDIDVHVDAVTESQNDRMSWMGHTQNNIRGPFISVANYRTHR